MRGVRVIRRCGQGHSEGGGLGAVDGDRATGAGGEPVRERQADPVVAALLAGLGREPVAENPRP
jgi:hypothetical protein